MVLAKQAANGALDSTAVVSITFTKYGKTATVVTVTIEPTLKQNSEAFEKLKKNVVQKKEIR